MNHTYKTPQTCTNNHDYPCNVCEGGLSICTVCGCAEGSLATECPGYECWTTHGERIYQGEVDFRNGQWIEGVPSIHSPAGIRAMARVRPNSPAS